MFERRTLVRGDGCDIFYFRWIKIENLSYLCQYLYFVDFDLIDIILVKLKYIAIFSYNLGLFWLTFEQLVVSHNFLRY